MAKIKTDFDVTMTSRRSGEGDDLMIEHKRQVIILGYDETKDLIEGIQYLYPDWWAQWLETT